MALKGLDVLLPNLPNFSLGMMLPLRLVNSNYLESEISLLEETVSA